MSEEAEISICCDVLLDSIENGGLCVVEAQPGLLVIVVPDAEGKRGIAINFCPFCGQPRAPEDFVPEEEAS